MALTTTCLAAHHNLIFDTDGSVRLCCNSTQPLNFIKPEEALYSSKALNIQTALSNGVAHENCTVCWREQARGDRNYRDNYNEMYPEFDSKTSLKTVHIQYDNTCNLHCVYCGPRFSSSWNSLRGEKISYRQPLEFSDQILSELCMVTLAGGEPTLVKSNIILLERLQQINPDCEIIINSNLNYSNNSVINKFSKLNNVTVIASFENIGLRYEYIRGSGSWKLFKNNFEHLADSGIKLQASMILFALSAAEIGNAIDFALTCIHPDQIFINDYEGNQLDWSKVGKKQIDVLAKNIVKYSQSSPDFIKHQLLSKTQQMVSTAEHTYFKFLDQYDNLTNQNHRSIFTELY
jgi:sulfatase maturation enzyme AslB (radical SAM superfamily)